MKAKTKEKSYDAVGQIMKYEEGALDESEVIELFQHLLDSGLIYSLQGTYQRQAQELLENGYIARRRLH